MTHTHSTSPALRAIAEKVNNQIRITDQDCQLLFEEASLGFVGTLANQIRESKNGNRVYFNRNFHIEPTNVCVFSCQFCAYSRLYANREEGWELSIEQMLHLVKKYDGIPVTEVHIVGGVHPKMNLTFFKELLAAIKAHRPGLHIKAFTAVEFDYMFRKAGLSVEEGLKTLKAAGLDSIPGVGAEIFHPEIREKNCKDKDNAEEWLSIH